MDRTYYHMNRDIIEDRNLDEFIGICRGILADDELNHHEKKYLTDWIENHNLQQNKLVSKIYHELKQNENLDELKNLLLNFTGGEPPVKEVKSMATKLPLDIIEEPIIFQNKTFCLTGKFSSAYGNRKALEDEIEAKGGTCKKRVVLDLDYLVIGELGNNDWRHSNMGRKIEDALKFKDRPNSNIKIISEAQLLKDL